MALRKAGNEFFVYVVSTGSNDDFANTTAKFVNTLTSPIHLPPSENWAVCVTSLFMGNTFADDATDERFVKLSSSIIQPKYDSTSSILTVCARPTPDGFNRRYIAYEPENKEYFPLRTSILESIDITLLDRRNRLLQLELAQPTLVVLHFKKMTNKEFIVRIDSSTDPEATANSFTASLPPMLSIDPKKQWHVCLHSVMYNGRFKQIRPVKSKRHNHILVTAQNQLGNYSFREYFPIPQDEEIQTNQDLFKHFKTFFEGIADTRTPQRQPMFKNVRYSTSEQRLKFDSIFITEIQIPVDYATMLGVRGKVRKGDLIHIKCQEKTTVTFQEAMNANVFVPNYMLLYTNCIDYSNIGSKYSVPVLKTIPIEIAPAGEDLNYRQYEPVTEEYHRVSYSQLNDLKFWVQQVDGQPVQFLDEKQRMILSLKFIQK